jgi:hypothetical protein
MEVFMASLADEEDSTRKLTNRQKTFARHIVEGVFSNAECARKAGYVPDTAAIYASRLLNGRDFPHVLEYIEELREERERQYGVTTIGQLERLSKLSKGAEEAGQFSAAINAEKIRSALGGLTIDRRENINTIDQMSRTEILGRLEALRKQYPQAFVIDNMKDVTPNEPRTRGEPVEYIEAEPADHSLVKTLSSGVLYLFPADQGPELARGGCSAAQGSRFEDMGSLVEGLRSEVEDHYRKSCGLRRV